MHHFFSRFILFLGAVAGTAWAAANVATAADRVARDLLPASTVAYLEVPQPGKVLDLVLDHSVALEIQRQPDYQKALQSPDYERLRAGLKLIEDKLGMPWRQAARSLTGGGLYVGFDLPTQGVAALSQAADERLAERARDTVLELARRAAADRGQPDPVKQDQLRGVPVYQIGEAHFATAGKWLVATNKRPLLFMVLENYFGEGASLGRDEQFTAIVNSKSGQPAAWLYVDLRVLRFAGVLKKALDKKSDNPVVELIAGGILGAVPDAAYVTAALELDASRLKLTTSLPCDPQFVAKKREFYFGPQGDGNAPPLLKPDGTLLTLSTYRDLASLWRHAPDLFDERVNARLAEAEGKLTTFFAGRNFRDEILGNLQPGMQIVVTRQEFPPAGITPAIKLPAAAVVMRMKTPEETTRIFKISFQSLVGFLNVVGGMKKIDPLDLSSERIGGALVVSTEYLPPVKAEDRTEAAIHFNASPTAAFVGDRFILASARPLALQLVEQVERESRVTPGVNTQVFVDGKLAQAALADNRTPLVARNMLDKGHERAAAEKEIDGLLQILRGLESSSLRLTSDQGRLQLDIELVLAGAK